MTRDGRGRGIPTAVLERARQLAVKTQAEPRQVVAPNPTPPAAPGAARRQATRDKVIAALKKLHPMD
jgi:hypothetical protein